jgi:hypothetical protein
MKTQGALRKFHPVTTRDGRTAGSVLFLFFVRFHSPDWSLAQQRSSSSGLNCQDTCTRVVGQNLEDREPSSRYNSAQPASPNAPSATRPGYSSGNSLTADDRFHIYRQSILGPYTLVGPALGGGIGQWEDEPPEWREGGEGYARRLASGVGRQLIAETIRFGVSVADDEDPRYHPSGESGVWGRVRHVFVETFTSETSRAREFRRIHASPVPMGRRSFPICGIPNPDQRLAGLCDADQPHWHQAWVSIYFKDRIRIHCRTGTVRS